MAVVIKKSNIIEISATGVIVDVDDDSVKIQDEKTGVQDFDFAMFKDFIGKEVSIKVKNTEKV